jgi:hypothetical protein
MKQKKQLVALAVLLLVAGFVWFLYLDHGRPGLTADAGSLPQAPKLLSVENPQLHTEAVGRARKTEYKSGGRNIFSRELPPPPPPKNPFPKPVDPNIPKEPPPVVIPTVPPLPVKFYGFGTVPNGTVRLAFFTNGEDIYVVAEGELLLNRFRILRIGNTNLEYEEVSTGLRGTAILEEQGAPPAP